MYPFAYRSVATAESAVAEASAPGATYFAGGTQLLDLMKLGVMRPETLVDINALGREHAAIRVTANGLRLGALARMATVADHPDVQRDYPVIAQALALAASPQLRNMGSLAGNILQRTRCMYFRDAHQPACNKRVPGSGCAAMGGIHRKHAVLGVSDRCIASYPGDFAQALVALDADLEILSTRGTRRLPVEALHRLPGDRPDLETNLHPSELITAIHVPHGPWTRRSLYLKVRDRESYEFGLATVAVALQLEGDLVADVRIALGGLSAKPWRAREAEAALVGAPLTEAAARQAAEHAFAAAITHRHTAWKPALGKNVVVHALLRATQLEISHDPTR